METWLSLLTAIFSGLSLIIVWKGYLLAKDYLGQHEEKISIERRRLASENGLRALLHVDHSISMLFNINKLVLEDKYNSIKSFARSKKNGVSDGIKKPVYSICRITGIFHLNYRRDWESLLLLIKEIQLNGVLLNEAEFEPLFKAYDQSIKNLVDLMNIENDKILKNGLSDLTYPFAKDVIPMSHSDSEKPVIKACDLAGKNLKEFFQRNSK